MCPFCFYFCIQIMLKTDMEDKKSLAGAWVEAARPRTLPASVSPVLLGCALAYYDGMFDITPAVLCLLVALFAQIASNFANDYFDFKKGADREDRLGPERAVAQGWITPKAMLTGTFAMLGLACLSGLLLICFADWRLPYVCWPILPVLFLWLITDWEMSAYCCFTGLYRFVSPTIYRR